MKFDKLRPCIALIARLSKKKNHLLIKTLILLLQEKETECGTYAHVFIFWSLTCESILFFGGR